MIYTIHAKSDCQFCHGSGTVYDSVPWGMGSTLMPNSCDCALDNLPDDFDDENDDFIIEPAYSGGDGIVTKGNVYEDNDDLYLEEEA